MTDLVPYQPQQTSLELAPAAWKLAEKIATTEFVPVALRGKPEAVLACILAGHEAGISPMQALAKIHIIEGRPAMSAELMRALVLRHGHELNYTDISNTSVTAEGRRKGSERWLRVTWTMDDARAAGLDGKQNWRKWPRAMLIARATAELARMLFPDVLAGISHTIEELSDGDLVDLGPAEPVAAPTTAPPARTARARRAVTRQAEPAVVDERQEPPAGEVPDLPEPEEIVDAEVIDDAAPESAESSGDIVDAEVIDDAQAEPERPPAPEPEEDEWVSGEWTSGDFQSDTPGSSSTNARAMTGPQMIAMRLAERFDIRGSGETARDLRLQAIAVILGRKIVSSKDLTPEETRTILRRILEWPADRPLWPPAEPDETATVQESPEPAPEPTAPAEEAPARRQRPARPGSAVVAATPPAAPPAVHPEDWTGDQWRTFLAARKVKVTEAMKEAQRLGATRDPQVSVALLDSLAGSGLAEELVGWAEDLSLERNAK